MDTLTIKVNKAKILEIIDFYNIEPIENKDSYDLFHIRTMDGILIDGYKTKNLDSFTVIFKGEKTKIELEASIFVSDDSKKVLNSPKHFLDCGEQIGSDEVGVGDFFGPIIVTASYFTKDDLTLIDKLKIKDSKKITDARILNIGKELSANIKHFTVMCSPKKVSMYSNKGYSTHWILAKLHNYAHIKLIEKYELPLDCVIYIDQFEKEVIYRRYVGDEIVENPLIFKTKGESYYPSVATSSVIARYEFLKYWENLEKHFDMEIPKGAGSKVDNAYKILLKKYDSNELDKYIKSFFRNAKIED